MAVRLFRRSSPAGCFGDALAEEITQQEGLREKGNQLCAGLRRCRCFGIGLAEAKRSLTCQQHFTTGSERMLFCPAEIRQ
jgi:hypothetical protein